MKHLIVTEGYEVIPIKTKGENCLTNHEADELAQHVTIKGLDSENILIGRSQVRFINYVGYIQLSSCSIEILPKVRGNDVTNSRRVLYHLLKRTGFIKIQESEIGDLALMKESLLEILGFIFSKLLHHEIKKGLYQSYINENENLHRIRGKIDFKKQIKNSASKSTTVACIYDNFTTDHLLNRVFKSVMMLLLRNVNFNETQRLLRHDIVSFDEVCNVHIPLNQLNLVHFNRNNQRFYYCYQLAKLILSETISTSQKDLSKNFSILFKMNELYEEYIAFLAKQIYTDVTVKDRRYKLLVNEKTGNKNFTLEPDLLINKNGEKQLIIDTKWKTYNPSSSNHGVQRNDLYQMYAYLTRYDMVQSVVLLYPYGFDSSYESGVCLKSWNLEKDPGKKIKCYTINYEDEKEAIGELRKIVEEGA